MDLKDIDLNLLLVFDELRRHRRVSATAAALGLSQPGVSNALNRLRRLLGDELFLRTPRGMSPTPYAENIAEPIAEALATLRQTLAARAHFDPAQSEAVFTLALTDVGEIYFLPELMQHLGREAPGVTLDTRRSTDTDLKIDMERGHVDLALGFLPNLRAGFMQRRLFQQSYVCLFRQNLPEAQRPHDLARFEAAEHVQVTAVGTGHSLIDDALRRSGAERRVRLRVPHFMALAQVLQATAMLAVVPERFAGKVCGPFGLASAPCPVPLPHSAIHAIWHAQKQRDPASRWLRQQVFTLFAEGEL
ncbi:MAG: LysR family transcriptional regulator [Pigmentiphaga sp.]|nr:LysR family transcriptional regulator [Pigmentiphaga sp.]